MRIANPLLGTFLLISASLATSQVPPCNPCLDGPERNRRTVVIERDFPSPSPSEVASMIRELGGELRDITHDCGVSRTRTYGQTSFSVRACNWGGRYPALLIEPLSADDRGTVVVLASNGSKLEVLFEDAVSASLVETFSGLLKEDFDRMFEELSEAADG